MVSFNVNGLNDPTKRRIIFTHLRKTKGDIFLLQESHATEDSVRQWRQEWGRPMVTNNGVQNSRGVMILGRRDLDWKISQTLKDEDGRILALDVDINGLQYSIASIYAPTQDQPSLQLETYNKVEEFLGTMSASNIILGGDLNCILNPAVDKSTSAPPPHMADVVRNKVLGLMDEWGLTDIWRVRNQNNPGFTFRRGSYSSRLDYLLISNHLSELVKNLSVDVVVHSDHAMISLSFSPSHAQRGPGFWKFNASLLKNQEFTDEMNEFLTGWEPPTELSNPNSIWEWLKFQIQNRTRAFTKNLHAREKQFTADLNKELEDLYKRADSNKEDLTTQVDSIRRELRELEKERARKIIFRSRCNWALYGERPNAYFLNLEKRKSAERCLSSIINDQGQTVMGVTKVLQEGRKFYQNLYQSEENLLLPIQQVEEHLHQIDLPTLSDTDKTSLEAPLSQAELRGALSKLNLCNTQEIQLWPELHQLHQGHVRRDRILSRQCRPLFPVLQPGEGY